MSFWNVWLPKIKRYHFEGYDYQKWNLNFKIVHKIGRDKYQQWNVFYVWLSKYVLGCPTQSKIDCPKIYIQGKIYAINILFIIFAHYVLGIQVSSLGTTTPDHLKLSCWLSSFQKHVEEVQPTHV